VSAPAALPAPVDRDDRAADVAMWLFVASLVMFVASLFSGYVLLRAGSDAWPTPWIRVGFAAVADPWFRLLWLVVAVATARSAARNPPAGGSWIARHPLHVAAFAGLVFAVRTISAGQALVRAGHGPSTHVAPASWFALNGVLALLVVGGVIATIGVAVASSDDTVRRRRARLLTLYWGLMTACFVAIIAGMYLA
jgi:heme/copper-type cytochrome/quinol oxidase subunit 3